jgi:glycosyltransferase involved in cell wall biosynthesis
MKKIVYLVKSIDGGTGTFIIDLLEIKELFGKKNASINIIALEKPTFRRPLKKFNMIFIRQKNFYPELYSLSLKNILNFMIEIYLLRKELAKIKPEVILSVDLHCNILSYFEKLLFFGNCKLIFTSHINLSDTIKNKSTKLANFFLRKIIHYIYSQADKLICVSKELGEEIKSDFNIKKEINTIYLGVDKKTNPARKIKDKYILSVGRLVNQKDFFTLIDSFNLLLEDLPGYKLLIAGDGPLKKTLINYSKNTKNIKFLGWKQDIFPLLNRSLIFVLSSKREGLPYTLLEAMSTGIPVISTNAPFGPSEILGSNKYGMLVPIGDKTKLKDSMLKMLKDKNKYTFYANKSLERITFFSKEKMLFNYYNLINGL